MRFFLPPRSCVPLLADEELDLLTDLIYHPFTGLVFRRRFQMVLENLEASSGGRTLEVGCGAGLVLPSLNGAGRKVVGMDLHDGLHQVRRMLDRVHHVDVDLTRGDVLSLPFQTDSFDALLCMSVMEHLRDLDRAVSEVARVVRPGGQLILGFPAKNLLTKLLFRLSGRDDDVIHPSSHFDILAAARRHLHQEQLHIFPPMVPKAFWLYVVGSYRRH